MTADELYSDSFRNVWDILIIWDAINIFLALISKLLISFEFANLFIFVL